MTYLQIRTKNDINGNPRRAFILFADTGETLDVVDEGYSGDPYQGKYVSLGDLEVVPAEYRRMITLGKSLRNHKSGLKALFQCNPKEV